MYDIENTATDRMGIAGVTTDDRTAFCKAFCDEAIARGYKTGVLDADVTGPSIPKIFGIQGKAHGIEEGLLPSESKKGIIFRPNKETSH